MVRYIAECNEFSGKYTLTIIDAVKPLLKYTQDISIIDFVKIDAQGEDYKILLGMSDLLEKKKINLLKIEIGVNENKNIKHDEVYKITNLMHKFDYRLLSISEIKYKNDQSISFMDAYFTFLKI